MSARSGGTEGVVVSPGAGRELVVPLFGSRRSEPGIDELRRLSEAFCTGRGRATVSLGPEYKRTAEGSATSSSGSTSTPPPPGASEKPRGVLSSGATELTSDRLRLSEDLGRWALVPWLPEDLALPFLEPQVPRITGADPSTWKWPGPGVSPLSRWLRLYRLLHRAWLLAIVRGRREDWESCNVFNMRKGAVRDRMIVDRHGPSGMKGHILGGVSSSLFTTSRALKEIRRKPSIGARASHGPRCRWEHVGAAV